MIMHSVKQLLYRSGAVRRLSWRRLQFLDDIVGGQLLRPSERVRILDVGCSTGKDLVRFLDECTDVEIVGLDLTDRGLRQSNFQMVVGDAEQMPFPDEYFDLTFSIGVLEHILPLEKLARVAQEIRRVSKAYAVVVPSLGSLIEPHSASPLWHLRDAYKKPAYGGTLCYLSDEGWLGLGGFRNAQSRRFGHLPLLVSNLIIFERDHLAT